MSVIAVINQKGGCGKTTSVINLGAALAEGRKRVLLVDMDPQGHCGLGLGIAKDQLEFSMADALEGRVDLAKVIHKVDSRLHVAPSNIYLAGFEHRFSGRTDRESQLKQKLQSYRYEYDYILIDCPPNLGLLTINAMVASDAMVVPVEPSAFSIDGAQRMEHIIRFLSKNLSFQAQYRLLVTQDDRSRLSKKLIMELQTQFPQNMFQSVIRKNISLKEAAVAKTHVLGYAPASFGARDYLVLAKEIAGWLAQPLLPKINHMKTPAKEFTEVCLRFFDPKAGQVQVAGDFNNWTPSPTYQMLKMADGHFATVIPLKSGRYRYKFVVDGQWVVDPANPQKEANTFGEYNSVLAVDAP